MQKNNNTTTCWTPSQPIPDSRASQRGRILELLIAARGEWVASPQIAALALQYNSRLFELRRLGFRIENRTKEIAGVRHSWFRLVSGPPSDKPTPSIESPIATTSHPQSIQREREDTPSLFPDEVLS
jgi:hypothetical protein